MDRHPTSPSALPRPSRRPRILALVQAGGKGGRMDVLTRESPKPLLPFGGTHRLIDFPLANLQNSGVTEVWLSVQYLGQQLADALDNGKPWDLDRQHGGFKVLIPDQGSGSPVDDEFARGNAEELLTNRDLIRSHDPDVVVVMSADHVYRLDIAEVVGAHLDRGAECTVVTTEIGVEDAGNHATVHTRDGRVTEFAYKPDRPTTGTVAAEIFVYTPAVLLDVLEELHRERAGSADGDEDGLGDFGEVLLPTLVDRGHVYAFPMAGYWRDLGRPETFFAAHAELLGGDIGLLGDPAWPIRTEPSPRAAARVHTGGEVRNSLLSPGCQVRGTVVDSVLGYGVVVEAGATVRHAVVFDDVTIDSGAEVAYAILDKHTVVGSGARIGADPAGDRVEAEDLVLIGRDGRVGQQVVLEPGTRMEPGAVAR